MSVDEILAEQLSEGGRSVGTSAYCSMRMMAPSIWVAAC